MRIDGAELAASWVPVGWQIAAPAATSTEKFAGYRCCVADKQTPDLANLPRFLEHLAERDPNGAQFARALLDDGGVVRVFWGPLQMDVWQLEIQRGDWLVMFRVERGFAEPARVARASSDQRRLDDYRSLDFAIFAWARATGAPFTLETPEDIGKADVLTHGRAAVDWLNEGHGDALERVFGAWVTYQRAASGLRRGDSGSADERARTVRAQGVAAMEAAARGGAAGSEPQPPESPKRGMLFGLLPRLIVLALAILVIVFLFWIEAPDRAEYNTILEDGVTVSATPTGRWVRSTETGGTWRTFHEVWHIMYEFTVDGENYTASGTKDYRSKQAVLEAIDDADGVEVKYLEADPSKNLVVGGE
jgi:hypothetical protein